jgi:hypothetical protein
VQNCPKPVSDNHIISCKIKHLQLVQANCTNFVPPPELTSLFGGCFRCSISTPVIPAIAIALTTPSGGPTGSSSNWRRFRNQMELQSAAIPYVPRYLCRRVTVGWRSSRSGISAVVSLQCEEYRTALRALLQSAVGTACSFCKSWCGRSLRNRSPRMLEQEACKSREFGKSQENGLSLPPVKFVCCRGPRGSVPRS